MKSAKEWAAGWASETITLGDLGVEIATNSLTIVIRQAQAEAFAAGLEAAAALVNEMRNENNVDLRQVRYLISAIPNPYKQPPTKEEA